MGETWVGTNELWWASRRAWTCCYDAMSEGSGVWEEGKKRLARVLQLQRLSWNRTIHGSRRKRKRGAQLYCSTVMLRSLLMDLLTFAQREFLAVTCRVTPVTALSTCITVDFFFHLCSLTNLLPLFLPWSLHGLQEHLRDDLRA